MRDVMKTKTESMFEVTAIPAGVDPMEFLEAAMDDCPDCQAARARGERPQIVRFDHEHDEPETRQMRRARERRTARWLHGRSLVADANRNPCLGTGGRGAVDSR